MTNGYAMSIWGIISACNSQTSKICAIVKLNAIE